VAVAQAVLGGVDLLHGDPRDALRHLATADRFLPSADVITAFRIGFMRQAALRADGRLSEAGNEVQRLRRLLVGDAEPTWVRLMLRTASAAQLVTGGHLAEAVREMESAVTWADTPALALHWSTFYALTLVRDGELARAHSLLRPALDVERPWPIVILAHVVAAVAAAEAGHQDEALREIEVALWHSASDGVVQPFLELADDVRPLVDEATTPFPEHQSRVLAALAALRPVTGAAFAGQSIIEPLTPRELEVLRALEGSWTNSEIAARLVISPHTLRTHIKHIHHKLGTSTRRDAVTLARELHLL
jgi:LuxR family maltose regulon positive regulatory protein